MTRPWITTERILREATSAQVTCRSEEVHPRQQPTVRGLEPLDFLAEL